MKFLYDLKIGPKLLVSSGVSFAFMLAILLCALWGTARFEEQEAHSVRVLEARGAVRLMQSSEYREIIAMRGYIISGEESGLADLEPARQSYRDAAEKARGLLKGSQNLALLSQLESARSAAEAKLDEKRALRRKGDMAGIIRIEQTEMPKILGDFNGAIGTLNDHIVREAELAQSATHDLAGSLKLVLLLLGLASLAVTTLLSQLISRSITTPLKRLIATTQAMAKGELPERIEVTYRDCVGDLALAFGEMVARLRAIIGQVRTTAHAVAQDADQIGAGTEELARTAQTQASAAEETSASMEQMAASIQQVAGNAMSLAQNVDETSSSIEEMAASIQQVAGNAGLLGTAVGETSASIAQMTASIQQVAGNVHQANVAATQAAQAADGGRTAVGETIQGMERIRHVMTDVVTVIQELGKSSEEIGAIIEVIDDIAEQTNLLALNAAIEAARAGEHGRGFAVVADEVRKLAERSAKATGEIALLIQGIQKETAQAISSTKQGEEAIHHGTRLAQGAGTALSEIVQSVAQASTLMEQIRQATSEQTGASAQITHAVENMSALTMQVGAATKEQAKGSEQIIRAVDT
ncbi:MAG TPA: methyl-accepting chemotaxis protein, partial [Stenomitos sp.]